MTTKLQRKRRRIKDCLDNHRFSELFLEELGWDHYDTSHPVEIDGIEYRLDPVAHKRGCAVLHCPALPDSATRAKIENRVSKDVREHIIIFTDQDSSGQRWQWVRRAPGQPLSRKEHQHHEQQPMALIERLGYLEVPIEEEEDTTLIDVLDRVRSALDVERVTKRFYDRFKKEQKAFQDFIDGIANDEHQRWYSSVMLNRLMFVYFIQKKGFLDGDTDYLRNRLEQVQETKGEGQFQTFYRYFLMKLCHEALGKRPEDRDLDEDLLDLIGNVPYLNGGIFQQRELERDYPEIDIPDEAFEEIFDFFDGYSWHLDTRPNAEQNEINPDVLGYIFEKYINQKQMGAYYTKEDITEYISKNTIIPCLFDKVEKDCKIAFEGETSIWRHLQEDPDRYIYPAMRHGVSYNVHADGGKGEEIEEAVPYPENIAVGLDTEKPELLERRKDWNTRTPPEAGLPTEIWRETIARRQRYEEVRHALETLIPASECEAGAPPPDPRRGISTPRTPQNGDGTDPTADASVGSGSVTVGHSISGDDERSANCNEGSGEFTTPRRGSGQRPDSFSINDLITYNCDIRQFAQDVIERCESPDLLNAIWVAIAGRLPQNSNEHIKPGITVLDPTCGSGAFLFAALNILEPLYEACLDKMQQFLDEWQTTAGRPPAKSNAGVPPAEAESNAGVSPANPEKRKRHPHGNYAKFFRSILDDINHHPSRKYFIYKSIIVNNLYGVDIMKEAVEICKLRLFLKLVAQVDTGDRIEPLPDIDFNIRAGNTLVGFASKEQMEEAMSGDLFAHSTVLPEIFAQADECDTLFQLFRQAQLANDPSVSKAKADLAEKLKEIEERLNYYLADQYGIDTKRPKKYLAFLDSHQPFHWFVEFYGIMKNGGFDAVIGNPPYVSASKTRAKYTVTNLITAACPDIYAWCHERSSFLLQPSLGRIGMILPLSVAFSRDFAPFRSLNYSSYCQNWFSSFGRIPAALFAHDVRVRNTIHIGSRQGSGKHYTTRLHRWFESQRNHLLDLVSYSCYRQKLWEGRVPKLNTQRLIDAFENATEKNNPLAIAMANSANAHCLYFKKTAYNWLNFCREMPPCYDGNGNQISHTQFDRLYTFDSDTARTVFLVLNGKIEWAFWIAVGDDFHVAKWMFSNLPIDVTTIPQNEKEKLINLSETLEGALKEAVSFKLNAGKKVGNYNLARCRHVTDESDLVFARLFGFEDVWEDIELLYAQTVRTDFV